MLLVALIFLCPFMVILGCCCEDVPLDRNPYQDSDDSDDHSL